MKEDEINQLRVNTVDFLSFVHDFRAKAAPTWRLGQAIWNIGTELFPEKGEELTDTMYDPFYIDSNIPQFLIKLFPNDEAYIQTYPWKV